MKVANLKNQFFSSDDCTKNYRIGKVLGRGNFAKVRHGIHKATNKAYAVKILNKNLMTKADKLALKTEVEILCRIQHPNIVGMKEVYDTKTKVYLIMDLMTGGELFDRIVQLEKYTEADAAKLIQSIAKAVGYCHNLGVVHRDLKPENLLFESKAPDARIKIADFGLAKIMDQKKVMQTACGTPGYVAPEVIMKKSGGYTKEVDMWSLGVIIYILLCGFPPFYEENNAALFAAIKAAAYEYPSPYWDNITADAKDLIDNLLVKNPADRLTPMGVLQHRWMVRHCGAPAALPDIAVSSGTTAAQPFTPVAAAPSSQPPSEQSKSAQPTAVASAVVASEGTVHKEKKGADVSLASAQVQMKKFNARRKFRAGIQVAKLAHRMIAVQRANAKASSLPQVFL